MLTGADLTRVTGPQPHRAKLVGMQPSAPGATAVRYEERLTAPPTWWALILLAGVSGGLVTLPLGVLPMLGGLAGGALLTAVLVSSYGSARIRVVTGSLVVGDARIPLSALGEPEVLDAQEAVAWRSYKADPRAFMLLRSYIPTALRIEITDPADPTPYVYLSTRDPQGLADALRGA